MKKLIIGFVFFLLLSGGAHAVVLERIIYAGDTPLASSCTVSQTGPMELTISACSWTTTGQARIVAKSSVPDLSNEIAAGRAQMMLDGRRVRGWLTDKDGNIIEKARTRSLPVVSVLAVPAGQRSAIYLVDGPGITMTAQLIDFNNDQRPAGTLDYIVLPFNVPAGTTDLSGIDIEVFTVIPGQVPPKGLFQK